MAFRSGMSGDPMDTQAYGLMALDHATGDCPDAASSVSRRRFLVKSLASGFALAAGPVMAEAIRTESTGLMAGAINIPVTGGHIPGYRAHPSTGKRFPVVLVIGEIFGVHEHIQDICRRFAKRGYYAIAPELFSREGDVNRMTDIQTILRDVVAKTPDAEVLSDLDASVTFAAGEAADVTRVGAVGYCWGGRIVWLSAAHRPTLKAGIAYYGLLNGMQSDIRPKDPIDLADSIVVPVLGLYAGLDTFIPTDAIDRMNQGLKTGHSGSELLVFPGVNHGFNADYRATYDPSAASYAWTLTLGWLKDHGV